MGGPVVFVVLVIVIVIPMPVLVSVLDAVDVLVNVQVGSIFISRVIDTHNRPLIHDRNFRLRIISLRRGRGRPVDVSQRFDSTFVAASL